MEFKRPKIKLSKLGRFSRVTDAREFRSEESVAITMEILVRKQHGSMEWESNRERERK